jgi:ubiquinone/menaquinone biosynthesis C-methylase UbiE
MEPDTELSIDIGAGTGERYIKLANENPERSFLILDPSINKINGKPKNLHLINWKSDKTSKLPLPDNSVDAANISFLFGEIKTKEKDDGSLNAAKERYRLLLLDTKRVLKKGGVIEIADVQGNIKFVAELLTEEGFDITLPPTKLNDENYSEWARAFYHVFRKGGRKEAESEALPMQIIARLAG